MGGPEAWATMPLEGLMDSVQKETARLIGFVDTALEDEITYQRAFWTHWQKCPTDWGVTLAIKDCELACRAHDEQRKTSAAMADAQRAKVGAMMSVLQARAGVRP